MYNLQLVFTKRDRLKYISHLDLNRLFLRALKRANLPIWYTEGFNPHMYITFALPLALGYESDCECVDFRLTEVMSAEDIIQKLAPCLPEGIEIVSISEPKFKVKDIEFAEYEVILWGEKDPEQLSKLFSEFIAQPEIKVVKKGKKVNKIIDIKPDVTVLSSETSQDGKGFLLWLKTPAGSVKNINPTLLTESFAEFIGIDWKLSKITRKKIIIKA